MEVKIKYEERITIYNIFFVENINDDILYKKHESVYKLTECGKNVNIKTY